MFIKREMRKLQKLIDNFSYSPKERDLDELLMTEKRKALDEKNEAILDSINNTFNSIEENLDKLNYNLGWINEGYKEQMEELKEEEKKNETDCR